MADDAAGSLLSETSALLLNLTSICTGSTRAKSFNKTKQSRTILLPPILMQNTSLIQNSKWKLQWFCTVTQHHLQNRHITTEELHDTEPKANSLFAPEFY
jgi:hypothetical protein